MLIRALCLSLVLLAGPASPWVAAPCCDPAEACCEDEQPSCPVLPDGECSIAAAGQTLATVGPNLGQAPELASQPAPCTWMHASIRPGAVANPFHAPSPPRYLVLRTLRI